MLNKSKLIIIFFLCFLSSLLFSQEIYYTAKTNVKAYKILTIHGGLKEIGELVKGEKYKSLNISSGPHFEGTQENYFIRIDYKGNKAWVNSDALIPEKKGNFKNTSFERIEKLVMKYYIDTLNNNNITAISTHESYWENDYIGYGGIEEWQGEYRPITAFINSSLIHISGLGYIKFYIKEIKKIDDDKYKLVVLKGESDSFLSKSFKWAFPKDNSLYKLILIKDGDFLNISLDSKELNIFELIQVDDNFINDIQRVVNEEPVNLSKINWPQRASKEQPEEDTTTKASKKNYYTPTVNRLRFRATPTLDGRFIRHLKAGERLELIERGKTETIGDARGTWVKVKTTQGEVGWCFDAYLKEVK